MSLNRYSAKRDENEKSIIDAFRDLGCYVIPLSDPGVPDLLVSINDTWHLVEVKMPGKQLNERQKLLFSNVLTHAPKHIARTVDDVVAIVESVK
jgi:hypothetical protein